MQVIVFKELQDKFWFLRTFKDIKFFFQEFKDKWEASLWELKVLGMKCFGTEWTAQYKGQLADTPTRGLDDSRTGHLADRSTRGLDN